MRLNEKQMQKLVAFVLNEMKATQVIELKDKEEKVVAAGVELLQKEMHKLVELDKAVHLMMDDLERQNPGSFERYKMFPLLKKRLAKEKGIIL